MAPHSLIWRSAEKCRCFPFHSLYLCLSFRITALLRGAVSVNSLGISFSGQIHNLYTLYSSHKNEREVVVWLLPVSLCFRGFGRRTGSTGSPTGKFWLQPILPLTRTETRFRDGLGGAFRFAEMIPVVEPAGPKIGRAHV